MEQYADKEQQEKQFHVGDLVLVKLHPYRQSTAAHHIHAKLCKHYFGPFPVIANIRPVAYTLKLPPTNHMHPTFHVSQLKLFKGTLPEAVSPLLDISVHNHPLLFSIGILASCIKLLRSQPVKQVLVQWSKSPLEDATWENFQEFCKLYQQLDLEDKVSFEGGGSDSYASFEMDSTEIQKQVKDWVAKELVVQDEA